jgi:hypothetical protein
LDHHYITIQTLCPLPPFKIQQYIHNYLKENQVEKEEIKKNINNNNLLNSINYYNHFTNECIFKEIIYNNVNLKSSESIETIQLPLLSNLSIYEHKVCDYVYIIYL